MVAVRSPVVRAQHWVLRNSPGSLSQAARGADDPLLCSVLSALRSRLGPCPPNREMASSVLGTATVPVTGAGNREFGS
jgi:hypothetical protein